MRRSFPAERAAQAACLVLMTSCAPFRALDLPVEPAHARAESQTKQGFVVAARLIGDSFATRHHFGADLRRRGCVPVLVFLENRGDHAFEIRRASFHIVLENGERFDPIAPREVITSLRRSMLPAYLMAPLIVPPIIAARRIEEYNFELARSFTEKSFPSSVRFEGGDAPLCRAIFFRDPAGDERPIEELESAVLEAVIEVAGARPGEAADAVADAPSGHGGRERVGTLLHFTLGLSREEIP